MKRSKKKPQFVIFIVFTFIICYSLYNQLKPQHITDQPIPYNRDDYNKNWIDDDGDGINTRHEVLIQESLVPVTMSSNKRRVVKGLWVDPYTGKTNTDPAELDIDHMIPLKNAHISGAWKWSIEKKTAFANDLSDPNHLIAVSKSANRSKSDKPPSEWLPPNEEYQCPYISNWVSIKNNWELDIEPETLAMWSNCAASGAP
ncbi:MAG: HNH endonuclease family protein [Brevinema sp.]